MRRSVLVVDDDAAFRAILGLALRRSGFSVETASDGEAALRRLSDRGYDWLVTDLGMSPMGGKELCARARKARPDLRIAVISGIGDAEAIDACHAEKVYAKPVSLDRLTKDLRNGSV
jgi:two-component system cell cycle sensor histidine kinase/response regulator CckA